MDVFVLTLAASIFHTAEHSDRAIDICQSETRIEAAKVEMGCATKSSTTSGPHIQHGRRKIQASLLIVKTSTKRHCTESKKNDMTMTFTLNLVIEPFSSWSLSSNRSTR